MKLLNPTDMELTEAFAVNVAKWTFITFPTGVCPNKKHWFDSEGKFVSIHLDGRFTTSADAVLPWLEKEPHYGTTKDWHIAHMRDNPLGAWLVGGPNRKSSYGETFPRAAVLALLRAHGVEVEFTQ